MAEDDQPKDPRTGDIIFYQSEDGKARIQCRFVNENLWLTQALIADLFGVSVPTVNEHLKGIFDDGELAQAATVRQFRIVRQEGQRQVTRSIEHYNLEAILAVGYRVRSVRGVQFRQWATARLQEYLVKGFVMDDERLKNPTGWDYFDELLARIREIRASEKRFYQKVRDLFALSADYRADEADAQQFFATVQNKLLFAVTGKTAAEIVVGRANPAVPNMALTTWSGSRVRRHDVVVAKNYLTADEVDTLNRLVVMFLDQAELRAKRHQDLTLAFWQANVDRLLEFNERAVLQNAGSISAEDMQRLALERFDHFDHQRRRAEADAADAADLKNIKDLEDDLHQRRNEQAGGDDAHPPSPT